MMVFLLYFPIKPFSKKFSREQNQFQKKGTVLEIGYFETAPNVLLSFNIVYSIVRQFTLIWICLQDDLDRWTCTLTNVYYIRTAISPLFNTQCFEVNCQLATESIKQSFGIFEEQQQKQKYRIVRNLILLIICISSLQTMLSILGQQYKQK